MRINVAYDSYPNSKAATMLSFFGGLIAESGKVFILLMAVLFFFEPSMREDGVVGMVIILLSGSLIVATGVGLKYSAQKIAERKMRK